MFVTVNTNHVCGIDLHARTINLCVMDKNGTILPRKSISCDLAALWALLKPHRKNVTIGVESTDNRYRLIDGLKKNDIPCYLGHVRI